ncbi:hypothetical protein [Pendulispora albinea]|uniref:Condensin subunit MukF n=1 Tax=Pendulispora albinea TaxID=2741071 RepID=A0ABZ2LSS2_9BACT
MSDSRSSPPSSRSSRDPNRVLASLAQRGPALELQTLDLCFLSALYLRAERAALTSFTEEQLVDVFDQVESVLAAAGEAPKRRATHAIRRLREQRMIARVDGAGIVRAGEYALTRLANGIIEFFLEEDSLTRESLTVLTRSLLAGLSDVLASAKAASREDDWRMGVIGPLRITMGDLASGIERRQSGFDLQQEEFQREIAALLHADWFGAVERCQELLESTSTTLHELNVVLLRDTHQLQSLLQDVQDLAAAAGVADAETAARAVMDQVDRIAAWGSARQRAWSEYYQYVHRYLRDVVRLDPARTLTHRLRELLAGKSGKAFSLTIASAAPIRLLRDVEIPPGEKPPVRRPRKEREQGLADAPAENPQSRLEARVRDALAEGARALGAVTEQVIAEVAPEERFVTTGRVAHAVASIGYPLAKAERAWVSMQDGLMIEDWAVRPPKAEAS